MKRSLLIISILLFNLVVTAQSYLTPSESYKTKDILVNYDTFSAFDIAGDLLYGNEGNTIRCLNLKTGEEVKSYDKPSDYTSWPSFLTLSPDAKTIWAGFTNSGNTDDRIYSINVETGEWTLEAISACNFDLEFWNGHILISGLNSPNWNDPNSIFILDTSGENKHKKVIEIGGSSAGLAADADGNIYYGTYYTLTEGPTALFRWNKKDIDAAIASEGSKVLTVADATKLSDLSDGPYDCEIDEAGNLIFNSNSFSTDKFLAKWNGVEGDGNNYDILATTSDVMDWLGMIKSVGNIDSEEEGNKVLVLSMGRPVAEVYKSTSPKAVTNLGTIVGRKNEQIQIDLNKHFTDPDDTEPLVYELVSNSSEEIAASAISGNIFTVDLKSAGQTEIVVKATSNGQSVTDKLTVGVYSSTSTSGTVSNFEDLTLEDESFWNGSDETGGFVTGLVKFSNSYDNAFGSWSEWAYSNTSDVSTPGFGNQYSAITGAGFEPEESGGKNYGLAYVPTDFATYEAAPIGASFNDGSAYAVKGFYVTNSTWAALSMEQGDAFAKKFGGKDGNDPDWFKLSVWGVKDGEKTDVVDFYLADFRFEDNTKDYIIKTWQWVDLTSLGKVDEIKFSLASSDVGDWGINTPMYFCADNFEVLPDAVPEVAEPIENVVAKINTESMDIDLSNVFVDEDDEAPIEKSVKSNSNEELVSTSISDDKLTLKFAADAEGSADIVIEGKSNGKTVTTSFNVKVTSVTAVEKLTPSDIVLWPNPTDGRFRINSTKNYGKLQVKVYSLSNNIVYSNPNYSSSELIDISKYAAGQYVIELLNNDLRVTKSIIIQ